MIYLKVSLSDFLTLFSARTHDGFFWSSIPSWMLLTGACISMGISTIIACLWPANAAHFWTDGISVRGLALDPDYKLWPLWVWIYCIVWWWIQDLCKVVFYKFMHKVNLFHVNTASLVNVRDQTTFGTKDSLARMSAGMVEGKLLERQVRRRRGAAQGWAGMALLSGAPSPGHPAAPAAPPHVCAAVPDPPPPSPPPPPPGRPRLQVDKAAEGVQRIARASNEPSLRRASQDLALVRNSVRLARTSLGGAGAEAGASSAAESLARMQQTVAQIEKALDAASPEDRAQIQAQLESVRQTAERMSAIDKQMRVEKEEPKGKGKGKGKK
jgi:hypothetical protein